LSTTFCSNSLSTPPISSTDRTGQRGRHEREREREKGKRRKEKKKKVKDRKSNVVIPWEMWSVWWADVCLLAGGESRVERADELLQFGVERCLHTADGTRGLSRLSAGGHECPACQLVHPHIRVLTNAYS
jgi:hypothetical protein